MISKDPHAAGATHFRLGAVLRVMNEGRQVIHSHRRYRMQKPSLVSKIVSYGPGCFIGLLHSDSNRVLKFSNCVPKHEDAVAELDREMKIYSILDLHPFIVRFYWASADGICLEYHPLGSLRSYYES